MAVLPFEILAAIFEEVNDVRDLWNVRSASHTLCAAATPIAFRVVSVIATRASAQNLGRLFDFPDIAAHAREVSYEDTGVDRRGRTLKYVRTSAILELASSFSRIHQLPRLETVNLMFYGKWFNPDCKGRLALQESILGALAASFSVRAPSKLTSLSLHNLYPSALSSLDSPPFQTVLTTLRQLRLFMILDRALGLNTALDHWCHFWGTLCTRIFLAPTQQSLTELTLHSDVYVGALSELSLHALHFPHLYALSLRNLVFEPSVGAEYFILRHAPTLMRLELITCKLPIDTNRSLYSSPSLSSSPSTTLPKCEESSDGSGCWDRIWDRFAAELIALVVLHVDERRRDPWGDTLECRYVDPGPGVSYCEANALEPRNVADAEALRHFRMIIAARSEEMHGES